MAELDHAETPEQDPEPDAEVVVVTALVRVVVVLADGVVAV